MHTFGLGVYTWAIFAMLNHQNILTGWSPRGYLHAFASLNVVGNLCLTLPERF